MSLQLYRKKRDFARSPEPPDHGKASGKAHRFVIQKHEASRLHYDFRLEMGGTLVSWAVPRGLPLKHGEKRLAVKVEDHPLSYAGFEGVIPQGEYGGGTVMVWDQGTFAPLGKSSARDLRAGKLHVILSGKKLGGEWYLVRLNEEAQWLVIRGGEDHPPIPRQLVDLSVLSGKTLIQLSRGREASSAPHARPAAKKSAAATRKASVQKKPLPALWVAPMMAKLVTGVPAGTWEYEIKFDGFRGLASKRGEEVTLLSRNRHDMTPRFAEVAAAVGSLKADQVLLDGELVALDPEGRSSFQLMQAFDQGTERPPIYYYAFDLLELDGQNLLDWPLEKRKDRLKKLLPKKDGVLRFSPLLGRNAPALLEMTRLHRLEGLIGKRVASSYEAGRRSGTWIKLKQLAAQEFVVGGYTNPEGGRKHFGALLVGYYSEKKLCYAGKVGTGFTDAQLSLLMRQMEPGACKKCPFDPPPEQKRGRYGQGFTAATLKECHWIKPCLVVQVKFTEWTTDGRLRHPVYLGLRHDKPAGEVFLERPSAP